MNTSDVLSKAGKKFYLKIKPGGVPMNWGLKNLVLFVGIGVLCGVLSAENVQSKPATTADPSEKKTDEQLPQLYADLVTKINKLEFFVQHIHQLSSQNRIGQPSDQEIIRQWLLSLNRLLGRVRSEPTPFSYVQLHKLSKMVQVIAQALVQAINNSFEFATIQSLNFTYEQLMQLVATQPKKSSPHLVRVLHNEIDSLVGFIGSEASKNGLSLFNRIYKTLSDYRILQNLVFLGSVTVLGGLLYLSFAPQHYVPEGSLRTLQNKLFAAGTAFAISYPTITLTLAAMEHLLTINEKTGVGNFIKKTVGKVDGKLRGVNSPDFDLNEKVSYVRTSDEHITLESPLFDHLRDRIGPLENVEKYLGDPDAFAYTGAESDRAFLICGPSGAGKTFLVNAAAASFKKAAGRQTAVIRIDSTKLFTEEGNFDAILAMAERFAPVVIIIEELHIFAGGLQIERNALSLEAFLHFMDKIYRIRDPQRLIIVIGITNNPHLIDAALLRPGRFGRVIELTLPTYNHRLTILKALCSKYGADGEAIDLPLIARITEHASPSDLAQMVEYAAFMAKRDKTSLRSEHFYEAVNVIIRHLSKDCSLSPAERKVVAAHFAGTAFAYTHYGTNEQLESVTLWSPRHDVTEHYDWQSKAKGYNTTLFRPQAGALYVHHQHEFLLALPQDKITEITCYTTLAGLVAQEVLLGGEPIFHTEDRQKAFELALNMVSRGITIASLSKNRQNELKEKAASFIDQIEGELKELISKNRVRIERLTEALSQKEFLKRSEIDALLAEGN